MSNKKIENVVLFVGGNATQPAPSEIMMSYEVVVGDARKKNCVHKFSNVGGDKTAKEFWTEGVAAIKAKEGIEEV